MQRKDSKRSLSDSPEEGGTRLQVLVSSAREPPVETHDGARLLQRSAANRDGAATPNETVAESGELDKVSDDRTYDHSPSHLCAVLVLLDFPIEGEPLDHASAYHTLAYNYTKRCSAIALRS